MASTYSTSLKIQLMGNGEDSGTWGSITNTNWNLLEQAVSGVQAITMANSNYTLTNLNGVSDEARNMVLVVSGTNSAIYQVIAPLVPKFYVITNSTTGGYAITIGGSSGSIITIPNGTTVQVYCNGTNFYSAQTSSAGNFNVNGNLTVTGTSTLTGAVTASSTVSAAGLLTASAGIAATTGNFSGNLASLGSVSGASGIFGPVSGTTGTFTGAVSATTIGGTTITASTQFSGPGTGLTGTASSLTSGATNSVASGGTIASNVTATTQAVGTNNTTIATTAFVATNSVLTGSLLMWPTATAPTGYLLCDGTAVSRTTYAALFVVVGTTFGAGDTTTTFNVPNYTNRMPYGSTVGATGGTADAVVVSHTHTASSTDAGHAHGYLYSNVSTGGGTGGFSPNTSPTATDTGYANISTTITAAGVSGTNANLPPYLGISFVIKT